MEHNSIRKTLQAALCLSFILLPLWFSPHALASASSEPWECQSDTTSTLFEFIQEYDSDYDFDHPANYVFDISHQENRDVYAGPVYMLLGDEFLRNEHFSSSTCTPQKRYELAITAYDIAEHESQNLENSNVGDIYFSAIVSQTYAKWKAQRINEHERDGAFDALWEVYCTRNPNICPLPFEVSLLDSGFAACDFLNDNEPPNMYDGRLAGPRNSRNHCRPCTPSPRR